MRSLRLDFADRGFPVSVVEVDEPPLPGADWARVEVRAGGICGSDLHTLALDPTTSPVFLPLVGSPMELGHELGGVVTEAGPDCPVAVGTRVAVDPTLACAARGLDPCPDCSAGAPSACRNLATGEPHGFGHGFATGLGAGWSDAVVVHASQLRPAPEGVDDRGLALAEPVAIAAHGLLRRPPTDGEPVLVLGAGTIGLAALAGVRRLAPTSEVTVVARHDHQAAAAEALGATTVLRDEAGLAERPGTVVTGSGRSTLLWGGPPYVVEAVGTGATVTTALKVAAARGTVLLLGAVGRIEADLAPLWFKNLDVVGAFGYAAVPGSGNAFDLALDLLATTPLADVLVTHSLPRAEVREAVAIAMARDRGAIKVQLVS